MNNTTLVQKVLGKIQEVSPESWLLDDRRNGPPRDIELALLVAYEVGFRDGQEEETLIRT